MFLSRNENKIDRIKEVVTPYLFIVENTTEQDIADVRVLNCFENVGKFTDGVLSEDNGIKVYSPLPAFKYPVLLQNFAKNSLEIRLISISYLASGKEFAIDKIFFEKKDVFNGSTYRCNMLAESNGIKVLSPAPEKNTNQTVDFFTYQRIDGSTGIVIPTIPAKCKMAIKIYPTDESIESELRERPYERSIHLEVRSNQPNQFSLFGLRFAKNQQDNPLVLPPDDIVVKSVVKNVSCDEIAQQIKASGARIDKTIVKFKEGVVVPVDFAGEVETTDTSGLSVTFPLIFEKVGYTAYACNKKYKIDSSATVHFFNAPEKRDIEMKFILAQD